MNIVFWIIVFAALVMIGIAFFTLLLSGVEGWFKYLDEIFKKEKEEREDN